MTLTQAYVLLAVCNCQEKIISTGTLKATDGFTKWMPSLICILAISICMYTMSHAMKILPIGNNLCNMVRGWYSLLLSLIGVFKYKQIPNLATTVGLVFIIIGVIIVNTMNDA